MNKLAAVLATAVAGATAASASDRPQIEVAEFELENGMRWLFFESHGAPVVVGGWVAHVGSVNERPGITGISHLFEHMMFKGTHTIGTTDIARDLDLIERQEAVRAEMRAEMRQTRAAWRRGAVDDAETRSERYRELDRQFDALVEEQRTLMIKNQYDQIYKQNGGERINAGTTEDFTMYFNQIPANRVELWAWMESDRLLNPVFREFYSERDVVYEERRLRTESTPLGKYDEAFNALFWEAHPYSWPVVGWPSDIPAISKEQADAFYGTYYAPNNLTGVLVGDFDTAEAKGIVERYFGRLKRGEREPPDVVTREPKQLGEKRYRAEAETAPTVRIWWHAVPFVHRDAPVLDLLTDILSGSTGRLYRGLVEGRGIANECSASVDPKKYAGLVQVECVVKDGVDTALVETAIYEELERLRGEPVGQRELQKVKNQAKANAYRRLSSPFFITVQLLYYEGLGDWRFINTYADGVGAVTAEDIQRVVGQYFTETNRAVGVFLRADASGPRDTALEALAPQPRQAAQGMLAQLRAIGDPEQLRTALAQLEAQAPGAPSEYQAAIALVLERGRARLAELEGEEK